MSLKNFIAILIISATTFVVTGCAQSNNSGADETLSGTTSISGDTDFYTSPASGDPLEAFNRTVFEFNRYADMLVVKPVTKVYVTLLPDFVRAGVHNFLTNLNTPVLLANELLQWDWNGVNVASKRFVINSTLGMAGLFDAAEYQGLSALPKEDFGQTLGTWGIGSGPYVVLPLMGPSNIRDTAGIVVDMFLDPIGMWANNTNEEHINYTRTALRVIDARAGLLGPYDDLLEQSIDPYTTVKSAYIQNRAEAIRDGMISATDNSYDSYDFFEEDF